MKENYLGNSGTLRGKQRPDYNVKNTTTSIDDFYMVELYPPDILEEGETLKLEAQSMDGCILLFSKDGEPYLVAGVYRDGEIKSAGYHLIAEPQYKKQFCGYDWLHMGRMMYYVFNGKLIAHNVRPKWLTQYPAGELSCSKWADLKETYWLFYREEEWANSPSIANIPRIGNFLFAYNALIPMQEEPKEISKHEWFGNEVQFDGFLKLYREVRAAGAVIARWQKDLYTFASEDAFITYEGALYYLEQRMGVASRAYMFPFRWDFTEDPAGRVTGYRGVLSSSPGVYGLNDDDSVRGFFHAGDGLILSKEHGHTLNTYNDVKLIGYNGGLFEYCPVKIDGTEQEAQTETYESLGLLCSSVFPHGKPRIIDNHSEYDPQDSGVTVSWGVDRNGAFVKNTSFNSPDFNALKVEPLTVDYLAGCTYGFAGHRSGLGALLTQLAPPFHRMSIPGVNPRVISERAGISVRSVIKNSMRVTDLMFMDKDGKQSGGVDHSPVPEKVFLESLNVSKICCGEVSTQFRSVVPYFPILIEHPDDTDTITHYAWILPTGEIGDTQSVGNPGAGWWESANRNSLSYCGVNIPIHPDWAGWWGGVLTPDINASAAEYKKLARGLSMTHTTPSSTYISVALFSTDPKQGRFYFQDSTTLVSYLIVDTELAGIAEDIAVSWSGSGWARQQNSYAINPGLGYKFPLIMSRGEYTDRFGNQRTKEHFFIFFTASGAQIPNTSGRSWSKTRLAMYRMDKNQILEDHIFEERRW